MNYSGHLEEYMTQSKHEHIVFFCKLEYGGLS